MGPYVDGYVLPIRRDRVDAYREMAAEAGELWIDHGALAYFEGVGEDLDAEVGGVTMRAFPDLVGTEQDETVVFAFVAFETRAHRDEVNAAVMAALDDEDDVQMPFDVERMAYGGFHPLVWNERED